MRSWYWTLPSVREHLDGPRATALGLAMRRAGTIGVVAEGSVTHPAITGGARRLECGAMCPDESGHGKLRSLLRDWLNPWP